MRSRVSTPVVSLLLASLAGSGCGRSQPSVEVDAGLPDSGAGLVVGYDAGHPQKDAGVPTDAGSTDAGLLDAGQPSGWWSDAGVLQHGGTFLHTDGTCAIYALRPGFVAYSVLCLDGGCSCVVDRASWSVNYQVPQCDIDGTRGAWSACGFTEPVLDLFSGCDGVVNLPPQRPVDGGGLGTGCHCGPDFTFCQTGSDCSSGACINSGPLGKVCRPHCTTSDECPCASSCGQYLIGPLGTFCG